MSRAGSGFIRFVFACVLVATCKPEPIASVFMCDASSNRPGCGTTPEGTPYTCFGGKQLGAGSDFCAEPCATDIAVTDADSICLKKAKLRTCHPSEKTAEDPDGCGKYLACLRTDLIRDEGVCLAMQVCSTDTDCADSVLSTCGATVLKALFPNAPYKTSNLQCVIGGCKARQSSCPVGETCLAMVVPSTTPVPDICVPTCDSELKCPPNYACWQRVSGPGMPNVCIPTLPGSRCTTSLDCWAGECLDSGEGFSLCALPCESDKDCVPFSDSSRRQFCVPAKGDKKYCMGVSPFAGTFCFSDELCPPGQKCFFTSPYWPKPTPLGECRIPCGAGDVCPVRGGLPHACFVRDADRSCYPGVLGVTCRRSDECLAGRTCESLPPEDGPSAVDGGPDGGTSPVADRVCTQPCDDDADCLDGWNNREGYCAAGWCRLGRQIGTACTRDPQCRGGLYCQNPGLGEPGTCTEL
jgi:hypothetical protein